MLITILILAAVALAGEQEDFEYYESVRLRQNAITKRKKDREKLNQSLRIEFMMYDGNGDNEVTAQEIREQVKVLEDGSVEKFIKAFDVDNCKSSQR